MDVKTISTSENTTITSIADIKRKMHLVGSITKTTLAGAIVDIGLEKPGVIHISQLQKEPVNRVEDVVQVGQRVDVWVRRVDPKKGRIELTMIKPLDLEWREITKGMVVKGKVVRLEKFGVFLDIGAERPGLVHISEMTHGYIRTPSEVVKEGDEVEVKVIAVDRRKKKIKLSMKALEEVPERPTKSTKKDKTVKEELTPPPVEEEHEPTAMEIALREAMERTKAIQEDQLKKERKVALRNQEMEDILSRTIEQKIKSPSK